MLLLYKADSLMTSTTYDSYTISFEGYRRLSLAFENHKINEYVAGKKKSHNSKKSSNQSKLHK